MAQIAIMAVGAAISAYGAYSQAQAQKNAANYQAAVARNNATIANWNAQDAVTRGVDAAQKVQLDAKRLKGRQVAALAERGIDTGEGTGLNLISDTDYLAAIDSAKATDNANREAYGYTARSMNASADAELYQYKANTTNPTAAAAGSLLSSAGSIASKWYSFGQA